MENEISNPSTGAAFETKMPRKARRCLTLSFGSFSKDKVKHRRAFRGIFVSNAAPVLGFDISFSILPKADMSRHLLEQARIHPAIRDAIANHHRDLVEEVEAAVAAHPVEIGRASCRERV